MTPYRIANVEGRVIDPSRTRFGLVGAAVGAIACFVALVDLYFGRFATLDNMLLFGGSAAIALMLAYSAFEAPAGRTILLLAIATFVASFIPQVCVRSLMGDWVWPVRYFGVSGIACGLLLRLRRTRPGRYGAALRLAAIVSGWWAVQWVVTLAGPPLHQTVRAELFSRSVYLLLAAGMLDMRRWVGAPPLREAPRTAIDTAREIATTRACLGVLALGAALTTLTFNWYSEWTVVATADAFAFAVTLVMHMRWLMRESAPLVPIVAAASGVFALGVMWHAFDVRLYAPLATCFFAASHLAVDFGVARFASAKKSPDARWAYFLALSAIALHLAAAALIVFRLRGP